MSETDKTHRAKLIANPSAGDGTNVSARLEQVTRYLSEYGVEVDVALAKPVEEAIPIAKKSVKKGYSTVIAMGGDHTIVAVIQGITGSKTQLGIIPSGTQNDIAASLGIPEDLKEACALIASGRTRMLDLGQVSMKGRKKFIFFMVIAVGLTATIYPDIKDVPHGDFSGIKDAILTFLEFKPNPKILLTLDDSKIEVESMLVTVTNTPLTAVKNLVAPDASLDDGLLDVVVYPDFSKAELLAYFAKTANQGKTDNGKLQRYQARKIKIKTSPKLDVAAEGTLLGKGTARVKVLPRALRVIAPEVGAGAEKPQPDRLENLPTPISITIATQNQEEPKEPIST
jgi:diacylglycerol kinase (ATP)